MSNTKEYALRYEKYPHVLEGVHDANWITDSKESKSTSGDILQAEAQLYFENPPNKLA